MIQIYGRVYQEDELFHEITDKTQRKILKKMLSYQMVYRYDTIHQLKFELLFRVNTLKAARDLDKSGAKFTTFSYAFANKKYWKRLSNGGFLIKDNVSPSKAIKDITLNGSLYAFECSTAIAIVLYLAVLDTIGSNAFNRYFQGLYLYDWQFDEDLPVNQTYSADYLIGDVLHFNNPDFDPEQPWWRAENVVFFGDDTFYGHGIGIRNSKAIIDFLNKKRKQKPKESAYLLQMISRPNYKYIHLLR